MPADSEPSARVPVVEADLGDGVRAGFTTAGPDGRFNLSTELGDDEGLVAERRRGVEAWAGAPVVWVRQVHGCAVHVGRGGDVPVTPPAADAVVTVGGGAAAGVLAADCVPVLLADGARGVVAAVHAGRRGLVAGVVPAAVLEMERCGARPHRVRAVIGPAVCGDCYEVPPALQAEVERAVPGTATTTSWGTPALDLPAGVEAQLRGAGVGRVTRLGVCTVTDERFFSHRAASVPGSHRPAGRSAAVVVSTRHP